MLVEEEEEIDRLVYIHTQTHRDRGKEKEAEKKGWDFEAQYGLFCLDFICNASLGSAHIDSIHFKDRLLKVTIPGDRIYVCVCVWIYID